MELKMMLMGAAGLLLAVGAEASPAGYGFAPGTGQIQAGVEKAYCPGAALIVAKDEPPVSGRYFGGSLPKTVASVVDRGSKLLIQSGMADIGGGTHLYYEKAGKGPVVIFLHAHSLDRREWDPQFDALSQHYTVIRYDLRGYGKSDMPKEGQPFTHADDLYRLMRALKVKKASLVGLSLGGLVSTDFLALHPEMVTSAVVASGAIHDAPPAAAPETPAQRAAREAKERQDKLASIRDVEKQGLEADKRAWLAALMGICGPHREVIQPAVWKMIQDWPAWQVTHVEAHVLLDTPVAPMIARKKPSAPVLVVMGQFDSKGSHGSSEALLKVDPHARALTLPDAGHLSNLETPQAFTEALELFLAGSTQAEFHR